MIMVFWLCSCFEVFNTQHAMCTYCWTKTHVSETKDKPIERSRENALQEVPNTLDELRGCCRSWDHLQSKPRVKNARLQYRSNLAPFSLNITEISLIRQPQYPVGFVAYGVIIFVISLTLSLNRLRSSDNFMPEAWSSNNTIYTSQFPLSNYYNVHLKTIFCINRSRWPEVKCRTRYRPLTQENPIRALYAVP